MLGMAARPAEGSVFLRSLSQKTGWWWVFEFGCQLAATTIPSGAPQGFVNIVKPSEFSENYAKKNCSGCIDPRWCLISGGKKALEVQYSAW